MTDRSRRLLRRILLVAFLPVAVAGLVLASRLLWLGPAGAEVVEEYESGYFDASAEGAEALEEWNWFEPWIAPFDQGTALAAGGLYNEAIEDLERAFALAPAAKRCDVAVNLSLSWERLGDSYVEQGLFAGAQRLYETAQAVIDAAGPECAPGDAPRNEEEGRDAGEELSEAEQRLNQKRQGAAGADALTEEEGSGGDLEEQLDRLGDQDQDAADEKAQQEGQERGERGDGGFTDRPW